MTTSLDHGTVHQLELVPLGDGAWRLCDRSVEDDDPSSVVAYVEATAEGFEVVWLQRVGGRSIYGGLNDVLLAAIDEMMPIVSGRRPFEIPHLPPRPAWG
ncbi:hypothetical protein [Microbacterium sp. SS28]|uniref:hypothetical protein n=1 Tax=Microbacterium sp. SS28 TaxID=2919948 RepID=UPI001FAA6A64|nr:hypothetical protein [Microbacterium sp. SS28]